MPDRLHLMLIPTQDEVTMARSVVLDPMFYAKGNSPEELVDMIRWAWATLRIDLDVRRGRLVPLHSPGDAA